jgi:hypothetical protein
MALRGREGKGLLARWQFQSEYDGCGQSASELRVSRVWILRALTSP